MANINDVYPSKFLKAHDLQGKSPTVTIDRVGVEQVRGKVRVDTKAVLYFKGKAKGLLCNKTNAQTVAQIAGSPLTERWAGIAITLYATTAMFGADRHDVIRIKAPAVSAPPVNRPSPVSAPSTNRRPAVSALPPVFTDELEIDLHHAGARR